jgi:branched-chain amino acid transport system ATP-binding protein
MSQATQMKQATSVFESNMPRAPALDCSRLTARYGLIQVCNSIDLSVGGGELLAILGPNGAGKSSLLASIAGLVSGDGSIRLSGQELATFGPHRRAQAGLAFVPEVRGNVFPALSVEENLQVGLRLLTHVERPAMLHHVLALFPMLRERLRTVASMLSGGEQQMLAIAMAVSRRPAALLLDEPSQGLAPTVLDLLGQTFDRLKRTGMALIMAEQNVPFAARVADRFVVLTGGHIVLRGRGAELKEQESILAGYFDAADTDRTQVTISGEIECKGRSKR